jgi:hypothetical protein
MSGKARAAHLDDAGSPVPAGPYFRVWLYSGNAAGEKFGAPGDHHIPCHDDGGLYHAAHRELPSTRVVDPVETLIRDADLGMLEAEVFRRQRAGVESNGAIAESLGLAPSKLERVVTSTRKKLRALRERKAGK